MQKGNLTLILQGRQNIKRSIVAHLEAGEATQFVFADAASGTALGDDVALAGPSAQAEVSVRAARNAGLTGSALSETGQLAV